MRYLLTLIFAVSGLAVVKAELIPLTDTTIVPGERVGCITKGMTHRDLIERLAGMDAPATLANLRPFGGKAADGPLCKPLSIFAGTDRELKVVVETASGKILQAVLVGKAWTPPYGLKRGMSVAEVQKTNEKPFKVLGFGWGWGGGADFHGGKLEGLVEVYFWPNTNNSKPYDAEALGMRRGWLPSDGALADSSIEVQEIGIVINPPDKPVERDEKGEIRTLNFDFLGEPSKSFPLTDTAIIPGERVGPITQGMTLDELKQRLGVAKLLEVRPLKPWPLGMKVATAKGGKPSEVHSIFAGTDRELKVVSDPVDGKILEAVLVGGAWTPPFNLKKEASVEQVEKANGKPFKMLAFDWGYGGGSDFHGGTLDEKVSICFHMGPGSRPDARVMGGPRGWVSSEGALRDSGATVEEIAVILSPPDPPVERDEKGDILLR